MTAFRVLVVDDSQLNIDLATFVLESGGIEVEAALDAVQARAQIGRHHFDAILMDIQMPGMDGLELTRLLKADPATRHLVIIAFTAFAMKDDEARMLAAGCDGYLSKPIAVGTFAASVRAIVAKKTGTHKTDV